LVFPQERNPNDGSRSNQVEQEFPTGCIGEKHTDQAGFGQLDVHAPVLRVIQISVLGESPFQKAGRQDRQIMVTEPSKQPVITELVCGDHLFSLFTVVEYRLNLWSIKCGRPDLVV